MADYTFRDIYPYKIYPGQATSGRSWVNFITLDDDPNEIVQELAAMIGPDHRDDRTKNCWYEFIGRRIEDTVLSLSIRYTTTIFHIVFVPAHRLGYDHQPKEDLTVILDGRILQREQFDGKSAATKRRMERTNNLLAGVAKVAGTLRARSREDSPVALKRIRLAKPKEQPAKKVTELLDGLNESVDS